MRKEELKLRDELGSLTLELNSMNRYVAIPFSPIQWNFKRIFRNECVILV